MKSFIQKRKRKSSLKSFIQIKNIFQTLQNKTNTHFTLKLGRSKDFKNYRDLAYTVNKNPQIFISPQLKFQSLSIIKAILMHEISHAILISKNKKYNELETDKFAEKLFGVKIYYDKKGIENLTGGNRPRPSSFRQRNPQKFHHDSIFSKLILESIKSGRANCFADALIYERTGEKCDDCEKL